MKAISGGEFEMETYKKYGSCILVDFLMLWAINDFISEILEIIMALHLIPCQSQSFYHDKGILMFFD